jgi:hypothetical protein
MKKAPLALLCFLFIGHSPCEGEWTVILNDGTKYTDVSLLSLEGDSLLFATMGDTLFMPVADLAVISRTSHPLGVPGWLAGFLGGAAIGAGCAAATEAHGSTEEGLKTVSIFGSAALWGSVGALAGCFLFPEEGAHYDLRNRMLIAKKSVISSILNSTSRAAD